MEKPLDTHLVITDGRVQGNNLLDYLKLQTDRLKKKVLNVYFATVLYIYKKNLNTSRMKKKESTQFVQGNKSTSVTDTVLEKHDH